MVSRGFAEGEEGEEGAEGGEGEEGAEGGWSRRVARVAGEGEGAEGGSVGEGVGVVGEGGDRAGQGEWWAPHLSSWASPAGIHLVGALHFVGARRVGARLVAGGIVGGIASQSCWRLRGEPRAVDSLAVDRRTACMRWCLWAVQQTIHGGYSCGVGSPRGPEVGAAQARHGGHVRGDGRGADGACVVQPESGHPTVSASIVCSNDQLDNNSDAGSKLLVSNMIRASGAKSSKTCLSQPETTSRMHDSEKHTV